MPDWTPTPVLSQKEAILDSGWDEGSHAIESVDGMVMTYGELRSHIRRTVAKLNGAGYGRGDRFITVLSSGAEQLAGLVSLMTGFTVVPMNPNSKEAELERYMKWAGAKAVVVDGGLSCPASVVAKSLSLEVYELVNESAGGKLEFSLRGRGMDTTPSIDPEFATGDDLIAVFATSGTTAKPKLVPLKQSNIRWAHHYYQSNYRLSQRDRYLSLLPMFYAFGLITPLLSLATGGCVVCAPNFDPRQFYEWLDKSRATWMAAGPTTYQVILEHAKENAEIIERNQLGFIMSGNAVMPAVVMDQLEKLFGAPVLEVYAMTEAIIITSVPAHPAKTKRGSAGVSWGTEVSIMGEDGSSLPTREMGEIRIRGKVVTDGYENDRETNAAAFMNGWFRTGDVGFFDEEGFLFIKGRIKDMINRGGEKVIPQEVEEVLLAHPAVKEAVVFPVNHKRLGEDVVAAVVLRGGMKLTDSELMIHISNKLALYKVPSRVIIATELPKGATGKLSRVTMAESLGLAAGAGEVAEYAPPQTGTEVRLVGLLEKAFPRARVGIKDNFFDLGGYSLMAVRLFNDIEKEFGSRLPLSTLFLHPTVGEMAAFLDGGAKQEWKRIVLLQPNGSMPPLFLIHGGDGDILNYKELVQALGEGRKIFGIQAKGLDGKEEPEEDFIQIAKEYTDEVLVAQPEGPYLLCGFSAGGIIAFEMARQLEGRGKSAAFVGIIDMEVPVKTQEGMRRNFRRTFFREMFFLGRDLMPNSKRRRAKVDLKVLPRLEGIWRLGLASLGGWQGEFSEILPADAIVLPEARRKVWRASMRGINGYRPGDYHGKVTVFIGERMPIFYATGREMGWEMYAKGGADTHVVPGKIHGKQLRSPNVQYLARRMNEAMDRGWTGQ